MNVLAVRPDETMLDSENVLGVLEFHAIPDVRIGQDELADMWKRHGLDISFVPRIRPVDAFRRATSAMERTITINESGNPYEVRIEVDDVTNDANRVVRLLNRKLIDKVNQETPLRTVGKFEFDRASGTMLIYGVPSAQQEYDYQSILYEAKELFTEYKDYHNKQTLRNIVNRLVASTRPVGIVERSQGKFIPKASISTMRNLQSFLEELADRVPGQDCSLDLIPLVDSKDLRRVISRRLTSEIQEEAADILAEAQEARKKGKLKIEKAQALAERFIELRKKVEEYESLMSTTMPELRKHIAWALNHMQLDEEDEAETQDGIEPLPLE